MTRLRKIRQVLPYVGAILGLIVVYRFTRPVLFYIPSDCVCTDWSDRIWGHVVFNPIRNRAPERVADQFLGDVREGRVSALADQTLATQVATDRGHFSQLRWKLAFREDSGKSVDLYYKLDAFGDRDPSFANASEGVIEMQRVKGNWRAEDFSAVW